MYSAASSGVITGVAAAFGLGFELPMGPGAFELGGIFEVGFLVEMGTWVEVAAVLILGAVVEVEAVNVMSSGCVLSTGTGRWKGSLSLGNISPSSRKMWGLTLIYVHWHWPYIRYLCRSHGNHFHDSCTLAGYEFYL